MARGCSLCGTIARTPRTLPVLQRNPKNLDDVDPNSEAHIYDAIRYALQADCSPHIRFRRVVIGNAKGHRHSRHLAYTVSRKIVQPVGSGIEPSSSVELPVLKKWMLPGMSSIIANTTPLKVRCQRETFQNEIGIALRGRILCGRFAR